jgi:hypothetical protein
MNAIKTLHIRRYTSKDKPVWDAFIQSANNGLFLFLRDYMQYHAKRFDDHSLMAYEGDVLIAVLPANLRAKTLYSHEGLTFGGWITSQHMTSTLMLALFEGLHKHMKAEKISKLVYKPVPHMYQGIAIEADLYALFRNDAQLIASSVTSTIDCRQKLPFSQRRRRGVAKARKANLTVKRSENYGEYFKILEEVLQAKYAAAPTHNLKELTGLAKAFPDNIQLFAAFSGKKMLAGVVIYESAHVAHAQYIASSEEGKELGALDMLFDHLIQDVFAHKRYFDFGTSNEKQGRYLNENLITQKEEFGARSIVQSVFEMPARTR